MALVESSIRRDEIAKCLKNGLNLGDVSDRSSSLERNLGRGTSCHFFFYFFFFFYKLYRYRKRILSILFSFIKNRELHRIIELPIESRNHIRKRDPRIREIRICHEMSEREREKERVVYICESFKRVLDLFVA